MGIETINFKLVDFIDTEVKDYVKELLNADIRVFMYHENKRVSWFKLAKGDNIGYFQRERFVGFSFSTVHKPNRKSGTGYQSENEIINPKIENALKSFQYKPDWAGYDGVEVEKYKNIDDYFNKEGILRFKEIKL